MQEFEDQGPEYRQGTYLGRLPKELRQLATRYQESCNYNVSIQIRDGNNRFLTSDSNKGAIINHIPFQRGVGNNITMKEFIFNVKQGINTFSFYNVTPSYYLAASNRKNRFGLIGRVDVGSFVFQLEMCRELEDALLEMEAFQNS